MCDAHSIIKNLAIQHLLMRISRKVSEAGSPLGAHAFSNCEREGVMLIPSASQYNGMNYYRKPQM